MKRVALIGDSPLVTSGFAQIMKMTVDAFLEDGTFDVAVLGTIDTKIRDQRELPYWYVPVCSHDQSGSHILIDFLQATRPDVIFTVADPGSLYNRLQQLNMAGMREFARSIFYFPIEGLPIQPAYAKVASSCDFPVTYCKFGAKALKDEYNLVVQYAYHGADHGPFEQYDAETRRELRKKVGWHGKFIVCQVGVNKRTNRYPVLLKAMGVLLEQGYDDIYMYLHTSPIEVHPGSNMAGWALGWMIDHTDIMARDKFGKSHVLFAPEYLEGGHIYRGVKYRLPVDEILALDVDEEFDGSPESRRAQVFGKTGFVARMNMLDMYIDVASAHGWNLPLSEAMRCGIPGATVDDGFARTEVYVETGAAYPMQPSPVSDYWHTGVELPLVGVEEVVETIKKFYHDTELRETYAKKGKEYADSLKWKPTIDLFVEAAKGLA